MEPQSQDRAVLTKVKKNQAVYQERFLASGCSAGYSNVLFGNSRGIDQCCNTIQWIHFFSIKVYHTIAGWSLHHLSMVLTGTKIAREPALLPSMARTRSTDMATSISSLLIECLRLFNTQVARDELVAHDAEVPQSLWLDELGRLRVWAANIGAH
jgi:hypothetical protein